MLYIPHGSIKYLLMRAEAEGQAEQVTALKLKQKSGEREATNLQPPKVCCPGQYV